MVADAEGPNNFTLKVVKESCCERDEFMRRWYLKWSVWFHWRESGGWRSPPYSITEMRFFGMRMRASWNTSGWKQNSAECSRLPRVIREGSSESTVSGPRGPWLWVSAEAPDPLFLSANPPPHISQLMLLLWFCLPIIHSHFWQSLLFLSMRDPCPAELHISVTARQGAP